MIVVIDFETTGFKAVEDEVLQVSIIDEEYNTLLNAFCRPNSKDSWEDAQRVHGITPLKVANELPFERYVPTVLDILNRADYVIAYNYAFEDSFLRAYGIEVDRKKWFDPMLAFAEIYGEWDSYHGNYKWQSLTKCAKYYGYEFKAHDSLEDAKATLYCYKKMTIELNYRAALVDYEFARTEDEKFKALRELKSLEELATLKYGFDYADELHRREFRNFREAGADLQQLERIWRKVQILEILEHSV